MKVRPIFRWYDLWVGFFWDSSNRRLYFFPLPCLGFKIEFTVRHTLDERLYMDDID